MDTENLFDKGALLQIRTHQPGHTRLLRQAEIDMLDEGYESKWVKLNKGNMLKSSKILYDDTELKTVVKAKNAILADVKNLALDFPLTNFIFIPIRNIPKAQEKIEQGIGTYHSKVWDFEIAWPGRIEEARQGLGVLFNLSDYPIDIKSKFGVEHQFINLAAPNGAMRAIDPALYQEEARKFKSTMEAARVSMQYGLREEFKIMVDRMIERLTGSEENGKPKKFKNSLVGNLTAFFEGFQNKDIFEDKTLQDILDTAQQIIQGVDPEDLRNDRNFRNDIRNAMKDVQTQIDAAMIDRPDRALLL